MRDLAGGSLEMGWIGPVTPPGDLDLVFGVVPSLVEVRGMALMPRDTAKPALVTDQLEPIAGGAHRTEGLGLPSVAALTPRGRVVPTAPAVICFNAGPALNRCPHGQ